MPKAGDLLPYEDKGRQISIRVNNVLLDEFEQDMATRNIKNRSLAIAQAMRYWLDNAPLESTAGKTGSNEDVLAELDRIRIFSSSL